MATEDERYKPQDTIQAAINGTLIVGGAGTLVSAVQNTLAKRNVSGWGIFTRTEGTIATFAAVGGIYELARLSSANLREKNDSLNSVLGGFLAGTVLGLRRGTTPAVLGFGAFCAIVLGAYDYTGGQLSGYKRDPNVDEFERKEYLRLNRRRPIEETIAEVGEGRGIFAPGYEDRRRERIKARYGIDVPTKTP